MKFACSRGSLADPDFELGARRSSGPVGETGAQQTSFDLAPNRRCHDEGSTRSLRGTPLPSQWFIKIRNKNTQDNSLLSSLSQRKPWCSAIYNMVRNKKV